ncbi:MAG: HAMP domain-containing sensor histidine kinase [Planctomycetota bacterium]|nr:HAMP domain-containing sensor histidine kinase [Planctomycetota bacterium]
MPDGGRIDISLSNKAGRAHLKLIDNGEGIAQSVLDNLFVPFFSTLPASQGEGMGLSLCYSIVRQHLGDIQAESEPGQGHDRIHISSQFLTSVPITPFFCLSRVYFVKRIETR